MPQSDEVSTTKNTQKTLRFQLFWRFSTSFLRRACQELSNALVGVQFADFLGILIAARSMHECVECGFNFWNAINFFIPGIGRLGSEWKFVWFFLGGTISWTGKRTLLSFLDGPPLRALTGHFVFRVRWLDILFQSLRAFRRAGAYEKRFSIKMTLFACKFKNLLSSRTRRGIKKRPLSESAFDTFFMFSRHIMKNVFLSKWHFFQADSKL